MKTVALLDADIVCFQAASAAEKEINWFDDMWTLHSDLSEAKEKLHEYIQKVIEALNADEVMLCFTDSHNFRKDVLPTYKSNRKGVRKPLAYAALVEYAKETFESFTRPHLEADDVMGILATWPNFRPGCKVVIVSEDKDLKTIAGAWLYNPAKDTEAYYLEPAEADRYFLEQTLTGDVTDGYGGCPNIGADTAKTLLNEPHGWEQYEHVFKSGPRKGTSEVRWRKREVSTLWEAIVDHFKKAGLNEAYALQQARCARILRHGDYSFKTKEPILWTPDKTPLASMTLSPQPTNPSSSPTAEA